MGTVTPRRLLDGTSHIGVVPALAWTLPRRGGTETMSDAERLDGFSLHAKAVRKSFDGVEVLHGVDLRAEGGRVLALLGENGAGKSTLVRLFAGDHRPDSGVIEISGRPHAGFDPTTARAAGIRMIFQEFTDAPTLTVAENISLGRWPRRGGLVSWREIRDRATAVLEDLGVPLDPDAPITSLRVGERQICEIARALADQARCLILDEPTAALSSAEVERLFGFIRRLRSRGVALIYITHRLDEVAAIADDIVVLRDGNVALSAPADTCSRAQIVDAMVGRSLDDAGLAKAVETQPGRPRLRLRAATCASAFSDLDLEVRAGEVVALYGKLGSGIAEVAEVLVGLRRLTDGAVEIDGEPARLRNPRTAIDAGVAYLPSDRQREGAFLILPIRENLAAPSWSRLARFGMLTSRTESAAFLRWRDALNIAARAGTGQRLGTLSGGNQQKVLLARWLERQSGVLVLAEPTRGVDVGARRDIYRVIRERARHGAAVLVATSDYEEVIQLADRAVVMADGRVSADLAGPALSTARLTDAAGGHRHAS